MSNNKGLLISFEGIDKCGKTTQVEILRKALEDSGREVVVFREPGSTNISEQIRRILLSRENFTMNDYCETLLYCAARAQLVTEKIIPSLDSGKVVILDRYYHSTIAYQGYGRGLEMDFINIVTKTIIRDCIPHYTFVLDISPAEASERRDLAGRDRLEMSSLQFFTAVRSGYLEMAKNDERIIVIDGTLPMENIASKIEDKISIIWD